MANHFRSSEGQDGMDGQQPDVATPYVSQPDVASDVTQATPPQAPVEPAYQAPAEPATQGTAYQPPVMPAPQKMSSIASQIADPFASADGLDVMPSADFTAGASFDSDAGTSFDPSSEAGFTTTFAPITKEEDTSQVNAGGVPVISFQGVSMVYPAQPNKPALENVDIDVYAGEFVFLVGHSGSGKSTLLKLITRELKPTHGRVMVAGQDLTSMRNWKVPYLRRQIGCVFQDFKLLPDKTIFDNVAFALECIGKPRSVVKAQVPEVLRLVGLGEKMDVYPDQLSGGEQQRVSVARAMVNRPPLLVCDEPTGNLDPAISLGIMKLLERINRTGTTILMATHDRQMVDTMRKRVIALEAGHVVRDQERGGYGYYGAV